MGHNEQKASAARCGSGRYPPGGVLVVDEFGERILGLALAAVAILVAFAPRADQTGQTGRPERKLAQARSAIAGALLVASFLMLVVVVVATIGMAADDAHSGNVAITTLIEAAGCASVVGLLVGGFGLALVIVERSRQ